MKGNIPSIDFTEVNNKISQVNTTISNYWNKIYPINSIYMSINSTSPATLFGGTWEQIKDTFLLAAGNTYSNGTTGGSSSHTHNTSSLYAGISLNGSALYQSYVSATHTPNWVMKPSSLSQWEAVSNETKGDVTKLVGTLGTTSNMPPYLTVYVWKRTA